MNVRNLKPEQPIAEYVERILVIEHGHLRSPFSLPLFANGLPSLLFKSTKGILGNSSTTNLTLFGQTILPDVITFKEDFTLIAYFFKPYALLSLFGITARELTDKPVDLNLLEPKKTLVLQEQLLNAATVESRMNLLNAYISALTFGSEHQNSLIRYATEKIMCYPSKDALVKVQKELSMTERTFQRLFEQNIGVAPNLYRRIRQFDTAFQQLNGRKYDKLSDIAFENGYADQSHYIRAFKEFTNLRPKDYLNFGSPP
jgi:AraC-like DNA-binding protein